MNILFYVLYSFQLTRYAYLASVIFKLYVFSRSTHSRSMSIRGLI